MNIPRSVLRGAALAAMLSLMGRPKGNGPDRFGSIAKKNRRVIGREYFHLPTVSAAGVATMKSGRKYGIGKHGWRRLA